MITRQDLDRLDHLRRKEIPRNKDKQMMLQSQMELTVARFGDVRTTRIGDKYAEYLSRLEDLEEQYRELELEEEGKVFEIMSAIRSLPGEIADVIYMRYVQRMSFTKIAHDLHQSESTVYRRHRKGLSIILADSDSK